MCQICMEKEYQDNITKLKRGGDYIDDKIHKDFMILYEENKKEQKIKKKTQTEKEKKAENRKNVGSLISKKFNRLMNLDIYNKSKKDKLFFGGAESCAKLLELAREKNNEKKDNK